MLEFNVGELATRLRTALGVRGRMPLGLDEHVIPVTLTADVTGPPWRKNPNFGTAGAYFARSGVNSFGVLVRLDYPAGNTAGADSVFVVTGWLCQPRYYTTATGAALPFNSVAAIFKPGGPTAGDTAPVHYPLITTERQAPVGTSLVPYELPLRLTAATSSSYVPPGSQGQLWHTAAGVVQPPTFYPCEIALRPGQCIEFWHEAQLAAATDTVAIGLSVQGLFYGLGG